jgi:ankyrin repeat protein
LQRGANVNGHGRSSYTYHANVTPLIAAAGKQEVGTMQLLLNKGADPNIQDSEGRTALISLISESACFRVNPACEKQVDGIRLLLKSGARTDIADRQQKTAMDYVARYVDDPYADTKRTLLAGQVGK